MIAFADYYEVRVHEPENSPTFSISIYCRRCESLLSHRVFDARHDRELDVQVACLADALECTHHACRNLQ
jgi:hypothetical protein